MNEIFATSTFKKVVGGAAIGAVLSCVLVFFSLAFMGHGGTSPVEWLSLFAQVAGAGAIVGAIIGAISRLVDGSG